MIGSEFGHQEGLGKKQIWVDPGALDREERPQDTRPFREALSA